MLRTLAAFEASATRSKDSALVAALAAEKARVLTLVETAGAGQKFLNVLSNGDFAQGEPGAFPPSWKFESIHLPVNDATVVTEGTDKFLRFRRLQAARRTNILPEKEINVPAKSKWAEISIRLRVKGLVPGKDYALYPGIHVTALDGSGGEIGDRWAVTEQDTVWKRFTERLALLPPAKTLRVVVGPFGAAALLDVDDIEIKFE